MIYAYSYQINTLSMSFSVSKQFMLTFIKCVSIAFIMLTLLLFCVMSFYLHNNDTYHTNNNSITTTLSKLFIHERTHPSSSSSSTASTQTLCDISLSDCSLALLLGLYISTKQLRLLGVL